MRAKAGRILSFIFPPFRIVDPCSTRFPKIAGPTDVTFITEIHFFVSAITFFAKLTNKRAPKTQLQRLQT
jgi:hypothetical protein